MQRGWSQGDLAKLLGTTQTAVSRLEDPSYGRYSLKTLMDLAKVFDAGMQMRFVSFISMLQETFHPKAQSREVMAFEDEASSVAFFKNTSIQSTGGYVRIVDGGSEAVGPYLNIQLEHQNSRSAVISF